MKASRHVHAQTVSVAYGVTLRQTFFIFFLPINLPGYYAIKSTLIYVKHFKLDGVSNVDFLLALSISGVKLRVRVVKPD